MTLKHGGFAIAQTGDNHIQITRNGKLVYHAQAAKKFTREELIAEVDWYLDSFLK